jgi:GNAT superfamily N-acetyltransferase
MRISIRHFQDADATDISKIICRNLLEVNARDYSPEVIEKLVAHFTPDTITGFSRQRDMFVAEVNGVLVGTAALARDDRTAEERYVCLTVFVLPEYHGKGIGRKLVAQVEDVAQAKGAKCLQVPASLTAVQFYRKLGYAEDPSAPFNPGEECVFMTKPLGEEDE